MQVTIAPNILEGDLVERALEPALDGVAVEVVPLRIARPPGREGVVEVPARVPFDQDALALHREGGSGAREVDPPHARIGAEANEETPRLATEVVREGL